MSLSVLIPVYNRDVTLLVSSLASLLAKEKKETEIILLDDASELSYHQGNQLLAEQGFIHYSRSEKNNGRILSRRQLARLAKYDYLLFLDCDIRIIRPDFIARYYDQINSGADVCIGGLVYEETEPELYKYRLHWRYGSFRESRHPFFLSSNFLIRKNIFLDMPFDSPLNQYGHEDTLWGIQLKRKGVKMYFTDNPVQHEGIEEASAYIDKSLRAVENLLILEKLVGAEELARHVKLYNYYKKSDRYFLNGLIALTEKWYHKRILKNLSGYNPSLKYFDWLRLAHLIRIKKA